MMLEKPAISAPEPTPAVTVVQRPTAVQRVPVGARIPDVKRTPEHTHSLINPVTVHAPTKARITSGFGMRTHPVTHQRAMHHGVDVALPVGTKLRSPEYGVVSKITYNDISGKCVVITHSGKGRSTRMCHLDSFFVRKGQYVGEGQPVALSGQTGRVTGPHLHLEVKEGGRLVDPSHLVDKVLRKGPEVAK